jgi:general stress protein 26
MVVDPKVSQELLQFLRSHDVAALATITDGTKAHATTIFYYVEDDFKIYFLTRNATLKYSNLNNNGVVGLVVTDPVTLQTVQVEGTAKEVDYTKKYAPAMQKYTDNLAKNNKQWANIPLNHMPNVGYYAFIQVTPTWIRWTDFTNWSHTVKFEQKF